MFRRGRARTSSVSSSCTRSCRAATILHPGAPLTQLPFPRTPRSALGPQRAPTPAPGRREAERRHARQPCPGPQPPAPGPGPSCPPAVLTCPPLSLRPALLSSHACSLHPTHWEITPLPVTRPLLSEPQLPCTPHPAGAHLLGSEDTAVLLRQTRAPLPHPGLPARGFSRTDCLPGCSPPPASPPRWLRDPGAASSGVSSAGVPLLLPFLYSKGNRERRAARKKVHGIRVLLTETRRCRGCWGWWLPPGPSLLPPSLSSLPAPFFAPFFFFPRGPGTDVSRSLSNSLHISEQQESWRWTPPRRQSREGGIAESTPAAPSDA